MTRKEVLRKHGPPPRKYPDVVPLKVCVFGTRDFTDFRLLCRKLDKYTVMFDDVVVISGGNKTKIGYGKYAGADYLGETWAFLPHNRYTVLRFHPDWDTYGKAAGPIRNEEMALYTGPHGLAVGFWDGKSPGTRSMIELCRKHGVPLKVVRYE
jgi:hypothetical protein